MIYSNEAAGLGDYKSLIYRPTPRCITNLYHGPQGVHRDMFARATLIDYISPNGVYN